MNPSIIILALSFLGVHSTTFFAQHKDATVIQNLNQGVTDAWLESHFPPGWRKQQEQATRRYAPRMGDVGVGPPCNSAESAVMRPVEVAADNIFGKTSSNVTIYPEPEPEECIFAKKIRQFYAFEGCFSKLGFSFGVAKCYAKATFTIAKDCAKPCGTGNYFRDYGQNNMICQDCMANVRRGRQQCILDYLGVSERCATCQLKAYEQWENECSIQCLERFNGTRIDVDEDPESLGCRQCTDHHDAEVQSCRQ